MLQSHPSTPSSFLCRPFGSIPKSHHLLISSQWKTVEMAIVARGLCHFNINICCFQAPAETYAFVQFLKMHIKASQSNLHGCKLLVTTCNKMGSYFCSVSPLGHIWVSSLGLW